MSVPGIGSVNNLAATAAAMATRTVDAVRGAVQGTLGQRSFSLRSADSGRVLGPISVVRLLALTMLTQMDGRGLASQRNWTMPASPPLAGTHESFGTDGIAEEFLADTDLTATQVAEIRQTLRGLSFTVMPLPHMADSTLRGLVEGFFRTAVTDSPKATSLGGENVLLFSPATAPADGLPGKADSTYLMHFTKGGEQDPHFHSGPRQLHIFSAGEWSVLIGGADRDVLEDDRIPFTEITFPPGYTQLSFTNQDVLHGFRGGASGFGAISSHWTDRAEVGSADVDMGSKDLMEQLTQFVPPEKIDVIGGQALPYYVAADLQRSASPS
jgi:hypothetical protein